MDHYENPFSSHAPNPFIEPTPPTYNFEIRRPPRSPSTPLKNSLELLDNGNSPFPSPAQSALALPRRNIGTLVLPKTETEGVQPKEQEVAEIRKNSDPRDLRRQSWAFLGSKEYPFIDDIEVDLENVKAVSLNKLIVLLTISENLDRESAAILFLTHRAFVSSEDLLRKLIARYHVPNSNYPKADLIRTRSEELLKQWAIDHREDFTSSTRMEMELKRNFGDKFDKILSTDMVMKNKPTAHGDPVAKPEYPKNPKLSWTEYTVDDFYPGELARQLCLVCLDILRRVDARDCVDTVKSNANVSNIQNLGIYSTRLSQWVATCILTSGKPPETVRFFTSVALKCKEYNNFFAVFAIMHAFGSAAISRLQLVEANDRVVKELSQDVNVEKNYKTLRQKLQSLHTACVPFSGMFFKDLRFVEDGNKDILKTGMINWKKQKMVSNIIQSIMKFQVTPYYFKKIEEMYQFLFNLDTIIKQLISRILPASKKDPEEGSDKWYSDVIWELSVKLKPRK